MRNKSRTPPEKKEPAPDGPPKYLKTHPRSEKSLAKSRKQSYLNRVQKSKIGMVCLRGLYAKWAEEYRIRYDLDKDGNVKI